MGGTGRGDTRNAELRTTRERVESLGEFEGTRSGTAGGHHGVGEKRRPS